MDLPHSGRSRFWEDERSFYAHSWVFRFGKIWRSCAGTGAVSYNIWYWFFGRRRLQYANGCNTRVFVFAKYNALGRVCYLFQLFSVLFVLYDLNYCMMLLMVTVTFFRSVIKEIRGDTSSLGNLNVDCTIDSFLGSWFARSFSYRRSAREVDFVEINDSLRKAKFSFNTI